MVRSAHYIRKHMPHLIIIGGPNGAGKSTAAPALLKDALLKHKQAGNRICEWRDNKVVWISAEHIVINK